MKYIRPTIEPRLKISNIGTKKTLQVMAERIRDRNMDLEDCTFLSKEISSFLEVDDPIRSSYVLEVSSGGLARPLTMIEGMPSTHIFWWGARLRPSPDDP